MDEPTKSNQSSTNQADKSNNIALTPELVQEISEGVYRLLLTDLRIERERNRSQIRHRFISTLR